MILQKTKIINSLTIVEPFIIALRNELPTVMKNPFSNE